MFLNKHHYESVLIIHPYCILIAVYHIARSPRLEIGDVCLTSDPTAV